MCFYRNVTVVCYRHGILDLVLTRRDVATSQSSFIISSYVKTEIYSGLRVITIFRENVLRSKEVKLIKRSSSQDEIE